MCRWILAIRRNGSRTWGRTASRWRGGSTGRGGVLEPEELARELRGVTVLHLPTGLFNRYAEALSEVYRSARCVLFGGEASDPKRVREVLARSEPRSLVSFYGPTETTAFASWV